MKDEGDSGIESRRELEAFCRDEYARVVGSLSLYCGDAAVARELTQDVMAIACRDWARLRNADLPSAWLHRVGINVANSYFRRKVAERRALQRLGPQTPTEYEDDTGATAVRKLVADLPRRQKAAIVLRFFCEFSVRETADAMGCAEGTVKALTHKGLHRLRREIETKGWEVADAI